jgi:RecB family exonuclease
MVIGLNLPRTSLVALNFKNQRNVINGKDLGFKSGGSVAVLATKNIGSFSMNDNALTEAMTNALKSIGPVKRKGLEFLFQKLEMKELFKDEKNILLIEEGLLNEDLAWRDILKNFNLKFIDLDIDYKAKKIVDIISPKIKPGPYRQEYYSASRLQSFLDCPQKFYFTYVEKIDHEPEARTVIAPRELGNLEHQIIGSYFEKQSRNIKETLDINLHQKIAEDAFLNFLKENNFRISESERSKSLNEIMHYSLNGIVFLIELLNKYDAKNIKFEIALPVNEWNLKGYIDCLIELNNKRYILLDFKRSATSIGSKKETLEFQKIQLWIYLIVLNSKGYEFDYYGYLNLSEPGEEKVAFADHLAADLLQNSLSEAIKVIEKLIHDLGQRIDFHPNPQTKKVCDFCPVQLTCTKGELIEH